MSERAPFSIAGLEVPPGRRLDLEIPLSRLPHGAHASLPCSVLHGRHDGPVVWVNAAIHGDELTGVEVVRRLLGRLRARSLHGTVVLVPMVNVFGVASGSRYLPDRRDLNRSFPGGPGGSMASRLAHTLMQEVVDVCDVGIDIHSGSDHRQNLPQIRADLGDAATRELAVAFGAPIVIDARERKGSLRGEASARGKTVLLYEGGGPNRFHESAISVGEEGVVRVLHHLGVLRRAQVPRAAEPRLSHKTRWTRAGRGGLFRPTVALGDEVAKGDRVGVVADSLGKPIAHPHAHVSGVVVGLRMNPVVFQGDALAHIASIG